MSLGGVTGFQNHSSCSSSTGLAGGVAQESGVNAKAGASENMEGIFFFFKETQPVSEETIFK